jgi:hypothetical protein
VFGIMLDGIHISQLERVRRANTLSLQIHYFVFSC